MNVIYIWSALKIYDTCDIHIHMLDTKEDAQHMYMYVYTYEGNYVVGKYG